MEGQNQIKQVQPFCWSSRIARAIFAAVFMVALPVYLALGFQTALPADAANYPILTIPSLGLETPVAPLELTDHQLIAPATIAGAYSQNTNKTLIIGHSSTVFKTLARVRIGQSFAYDGAEYRITVIAILAKADINMGGILAPADVDTIILMTCAGDPLPNQDATHRLIITAERES